MSGIALTIVTHDSADTLPRFLESIEAQRPAPHQVVVVDNQSSDDSVSMARACPIVDTVIEMGCNAGFCAGQNRAIAETDAPYVLCLNPDIILAPGFLAAISQPMDRHEAVGMVTGKLLRTTPDFHVPEGTATIDSTGIVFTRNGRHLDRGAGEPADGRYEEDEEIFGPSGAAALYRRRMLDEIAFEEEIFDTDFWSYREDADLAWRARLFGWKGWYTPAAVSYHRRLVTPERRSALPSLINAHSVKNRFLLRLKNEGSGLFLRNGYRELSRDLLVLAAVLLREHSSLPALWWLFKALPNARRKRRAIQSRRKVSDRDLARWFS